jgi:hypothetical protein
LLVTEEVVPRRARGRLPVPFEPFLQNGEAALYGRTLADGAVPALYRRIVVQILALKLVLP